MSLQKSDICNMYLNDQLALYESLVSADSPCIDLVKKRSRGDFLNGSGAVKTERWKRKEERSTVCSSTDFWA